MPIKPENKARYPKDWPAIRQAVLARAHDLCETCGVRNGALGGRLNGAWLPAWPLGERRLRLEWPKPGTYAFCGHYVGEIDGRHCYVGEKVRVIRIVLTIAHLDHRPEHCALENLRALCQRCHLAYDQDHHVRTAHATRRRLFAVRDLFDPLRCQRCEWSGPRAELLDAEACPRCRLVL